MNKIKKFSDIVNEASNKCLVDLGRLSEYAQGIAIVCAGEYGDVWFNPAENHIFVCLGDSHPFDEEYLKEFLLDAVKKDYDSRDQIQVTIENECNPSGADWQKIK